MTYQLLHGNNLEVLPTLPDNSVDSIVTDPPYELGFMGKKWDNSGIAYSQELWTECLRVLKPGGFLLSFGGTRTYHRVAVAIEDSGFELRDSIAWLYGSGFPKSMDISKQIDKNNGKIVGLSDFTIWMRTTGLTVKQVTQVLKDAKLISENGTMAKHYFAMSESAQPAIPTVAMWQVIRPLISQVPKWVDEMVARIEAEREVIGKKPSSLGGTVAAGERNQKIIDYHKNKIVDITAPATPQAKQWQGWGTALKPAFEPIIVARKPLSESTVAANVLKWGTGGINIDGSRIGTGTGEKKTVNYPDIRGDNYQQGKESYAERGTVQREIVDQGRWPANIILDEYTAELLDEQSGQSKSPTGQITQGGKANGGFDIGSSDGTRNTKFQGHGDIGGASRFFYVAKASKRDRNEGLDKLPEVRTGAMTATADGSMLTGSGNERITARQNFHPTVKPTSLMEYLVTLVTPPNGTVLDPFTGSGSTGKAAILKGFDFIGIEMTDEYLPIIEGRLKHAERIVAERREEEANRQEETLF